MGRTLVVQLYGESSVNHGMIRRQGARKVKHLTVRQLWLQQQSELGECCHNKIPRAQTLSDMLTHQWNRVDAEGHLSGLNCYRLDPGAREMKSKAGTRDETLFLRGGQNNNSCTSISLAIVSVRSLCMVV